VRTVKTLTGFLFFKLIQNSQRDFLLFEPSSISNIPPSSRKKSNYSLII